MHTENFTLIYILYNTAKDSKIACSESEAFFLQHDCFTQHLFLVLSQKYLQVLNDSHICKVAPVPHAPKSVITQNYHTNNLAT